MKSEFKTETLQKCANAANAQLEQGLWKNSKREGMGG